MKLPALRNRRRPEGADEPRVPTPPWQRLFRIPRASEIRATLSRNPEMKLIALVLSCFVWYGITRTERDAERVIDMPVSLRKVPGGLTVTNPPTKPVTLTLRGPRTILENVDDRKGRIVMNLSNIQPGDNRLELNPTMLLPELPSSLKVLHWDPSVFTLRVERLAMRRLQVKPDLAGQPALGYTVAESTTIPEVVEVTGPASVIEGLKSVGTEPIDLKGASQTVQRPVLLEHPDPAVTFVPDSVRVIVTLEESVTSREFKDVPIVVQGAQGAEVKPPTINLTIKGPQRLLHNLKLDEAVTVQAAGLGPGVHTLDVHVELPEGLAVTDRSADKARVKIAAVVGGSR